MVSTSDRLQQRAELVANGYSWEYVDIWPPKTTLYRHAPGLNTEGDVVFPVGTHIKGVPGTPAYVLAKAKLGLLQVPPGEGCECQWCSIRNAHVEPVTESGDYVDPEQESVRCQDCGEAVFALTKSGALSRLRVHMRSSHLP